jgi:hypothetical protein
MADSALSRTQSKPEQKKPEQSGNGAPHRNSLSAKMAPELSSSGAQSKPEQSKPGQSGKGAQEGNSGSAKMAPGLSSGKGSEYANSASAPGHHESHAMSPEAKAALEKNMSRYGKHRQALGSYVTTHYGYTDRPPIFDKKGNLVDFGPGMNKDDRIYFYKESVRVPITDEMAVYKDNAEKMGWKFEDKDIKQPKIESMQLLTDFEPKSKTNGLKTFIAECLTNKLNQSGKHEIGFVTPGFNQSFKSMDAMAVLTERDTGVLCVTDAWGSLQKVLRYPADQDGIEIHYSHVDEPLWMKILNSGIIAPEQMDFFAFSKGSWCPTEFLFTHSAVRRGEKIPLVHSVTLVEANEPVKRIQQNLAKLAASVDSLTFYVSNPHKPHSDKALALAKWFFDYYEQVGSATQNLLEQFPGNNVRVIERNILNKGGIAAIDHEYPSRVLGYLFRHPDATRGLGLEMYQENKNINYYTLRKDKGAPKTCRVYGKNPSTRDCTDMEGESGINSGRQLLPPSLIESAIQDAPVTPQKPSAKHEPAALIQPMLKHVPATFIQPSAKDRVVPEIPVEIPDPAENRK